MSIYVNDAFYGLCLARRAAKSYGFRTYRVLKLALYHSLGKLPGPDSTYDFF